MKTLLLIGDSIRCGAGGSPGYGIYVREKLKGQVNVLYPGENCRFAQYTLRYLHEWLRDMDRESIDTVHWNNGLWDVLRLFGDEPFTPMEMYTQMLERVYRRLRQQLPGARICFALNTPVIEAWSNPDFTRRNAEIEAYNDAARKLMDRLGVPVNDLYSVAKAFPQEYHSDWVHYGETGSALLADAVIGFLRGQGF